jgi:hypothetical protein
MALAAMQVIPHLVDDPAGRLARLLDGRVLELAISPDSINEGRVKQRRTWDVAQAVRRLFTVRVSQRRT